MIDGLTPSAIWLLEAAVDCYPTLRLISLSEPSLRMQYMRPGHGLDRDDLVKTLLRLQQQGDIGFYRRKDDEDISEVLDEAQLRECFVSSDASTSNPDAKLFSQGHVYRLTDSGAARWERFAEPNWSRFASWICPDEHLLVITAGSKEHLDELMANVDDLSSDPIVPDSIVEDILTPWDATYWKQLPYGFRICCRTTDRHQDFTALEQRLKRERNRTWADCDHYWNLHRWVKRISHGELFWRQPGK